jgi:hypothetical protein
MHQGVPVPIDLQLVASDRAACLEVQNRWPRGYVKSYHIEDSLSNVRIGLARQDGAKGFELPPDVLSSALVHESGEAVLVTGGVSCDVITGSERETPVSVHLEGFSAAVYVSGCGRRGWTDVSDGQDLSLSVAILHFGCILRFVSEDRHGNMIDDFRAVDIHSQRVSAFADDAVVVRTLADVGSHALSVCAKDPRVAAVMLQMMRFDLLAWPRGATRFEEVQSLQTPCASTAFSTNRTLARVMSEPLFHRWRRDP